jgi:hypothetical protein
MLFMCIAGIYHQAVKPNAIVCTQPLYTYSGMPYMIMIFLKY